MPRDLPKAYDPTAIEDRWAEYWVRENLFALPTPRLAPGTGLGGHPPFVILLPPPNVTGRLHMGHMLNQTEMDILTRWRRMNGFRALWLPGTDHAGIATQMMVERQLASEGVSREKLGRDAFIERVWAWKRHYGGAILDQMKRLGASVDWQREYFTMDDRLSTAVREAFVKLYEQGLIYRDAYIVNWCPRCQTAISDLEVVYDEHKGHLWEIRYPILDSSRKDSGEYLTVATTRPETMLGDVAVAIHPEDERYAHLHGKKLRLPLIGREIPIILDDWVSREFGTGAVKVTPAHDPNDFALGQRHHLPSINVMDETAHINAEGHVYQGLDRFVARKKIAADLEAQGLLAGIRDHIHNVGHCDRCKTVVEPRLSLQWFVKIQPLADKAIAAVKEGHIRFAPEMYSRTYLNWMENIHDWCISRQLWWGHRIPAWHCATCHKITVARHDPTRCAHCGSEKIEQSADVLDTWFSSGLLPVSVFGWPTIGPANRADFDNFYPTSLLVTGFDILFFWVARMIMLGCWFSQDVPMPDGTPRSLGDAVPFRAVYIHALVRDANREKMSKTKGNVIDPIEIVKQYGTDAVRFTLASMASPGTDIAFNVARTEGYRAFANKIWNAARFIFMNVDRAAAIGIEVDRSSLGAMPAAGVEAPLEALWIVAELHETAAKVNQALETYRFDDAANVIYQFFWGSFCDWYIEIVKLRLDFSESADKTKTAAALNTLVQVFEAALRLLSPFMPFLTEELWHALYDGDPPAKSIALTQYPRSAGPPGEIQVIERMRGVQFLITGIRTRRKEIGVPEKLSTPVKVLLWTGPFGGSETVEKNPDIVKRLAQASALEFVVLADRDKGGKYSSLAWSAIGPTDVVVEYEKRIDAGAERERLEKEIARLEGEVANGERQLSSPGFTAKAPQHIVDGLKKQLGDKRHMLDKLRRDRDGLPG
jgi:valyl-tRNA synthetase